jgi:hypothetical protein
MKYEVWSEGYLCTGMDGVPSRARIHGCVKAKSFREACDKVFHDEQYYDSKRLTWWGCRLFDNAKDARKRFG